ncbi:hypothetical protein OSTOST_02703 [Ostertagia ostertagi]
MILKCSEHYCDPLTPEASGPADGLFFVPAVIDVGEGVNYTPEAQSYINTWKKVGKLQRTVRADHMQTTSEASSSDYKTPILSASQNTVDCLDPQDTEAPTPTSATRQGAAVESSGRHPILVDEECEFSSDIGSVVASEAMYDFRKRHRVGQGGLAQEIAI